MTTFSQSTLNRPVGARARRRVPSFVDQKFGTWALGLPDYLDVPNHQIPAMISIGGGKGGVGKSILSANLAARISMSGLRVLVVDLDLGCANVHTHFGIPKPDKTLANFLVHGDCTFDGLLTPTPVPGVALIAGGQEAAWGSRLASGSEVIRPLWQAVFNARRDYQVDVVIFDLGAGTMRHTMDFFGAAHLGLVTVLPEPTSIENAYVFLKTHLWNMVDHVARKTNSFEAASDVRAALNSVKANSLNKGYAETLRQLSVTYPELIHALMKSLESRWVGLVVNQSRSQSDVDIGSSMEMICQRYFGLQSQFMGDLNYDDSAWKSLRNRRLLISDFPHANWSRRLARISNEALKLLGYL